MIDPETARPLCPECAAHRHSACSGDRHPTMVVTCRCQFCKAYLDEHGPFSKIPDGVRGD